MMRLKYKSLRENLSFRDLVYVRIEDPGAFCDNSTGQANGNGVGSDADNSFG